MKISNSKKQLARIISENGGWRDGVEFSVSTCDGVVIGSGSKPRYTTKYGWVANGGFFEDRIKLRSYLKNWHQTIVSRDEYSHLYPAPDADFPSGDGFTDDTDALQRLLDRSRRAPTIEQLAADYRNAKDYAERKVKGDTNA